ncbi:MAG: hypothetical protein VYA34_03810 [Myxococcota bacterium]|nr:hypothetical protein [Myxococcota bacterium]
MISRLIVAGFLLTFPVAPKIDKTSALAEEVSVAEEDPMMLFASLGDALMASEVEVGGSIRAKRHKDKLLALRLRDPRNLEGKIVSVRKASFPTVALKIQVMKPPRNQGASDGFERHEEIVIFPKLVFAGLAPDMRDPATLVNAGAYFLRPGDRVMVRVSAKRGRVWEASYIERK